VISVGSGVGSIGAKVSAIGAPVGSGTGSIGAKVGFIGLTVG